MASAHQRALRNHQLATGGGRQWHGRCRHGKRERTGPPEEMAAAVQKNSTPFEARRIVHLARAAHRAAAGSCGVSGAQACMPAALANKSLAPSPNNDQFLTMQSGRLRAVLSVASTAAQPLASRSCRGGPGAGSSWSIVCTACSSPRSVEPTSHTRAHGSASSVESAWRCTRRKYLHRRWRRVQA